MSYLEIPGASLYYEVTGQGPLLLCISGADGSCEIWRNFAACLKDHFTVVAWDRRGFSRSYLNGAQDYSQRLETDADDAARLISHLSPTEPATVIGNSSGAIVALKLLARHPTQIRTLVSYEPPAAHVLPDYKDLKAKHDDVYRIYRESGMEPAFREFARVANVNPDTIKNVANPRNGTYIFSNTMYWFEREFMAYPLAPVDVEGDLQAHKEKLVLVVGELSPVEAYYVRANKTLGEKLGLGVEVFEGVEHVGHLTDPEGFSKQLRAVLSAKDASYKF